MSDRVVIRCPGCEQKLGIKQDSLGQQIECPGCGTLLTARAKKSTQPDSGESRKRRRKSLGAPTAAGSRAESTAPAQRDQSRQSSSQGAAEAPPSKQQQSSTPKKAKPALVPFDEEFVDDAGDEYEDYDDPFLDDEEYDDDDLGESWLDGTEDDDWNSPSGLPPAPRKKKKNSPAADSRRKNRKSRQRPGWLSSGSIFVWVGAGLIAGLISIGLTVAMGFTGIGFLVYISTIIGSGLIGGAIRATAAGTDGWGPGIVAVAIAIPAMFLGRVGAYFVDPELAAMFEEQTPEQALQEIARETSDDGMIANVIEFELTSDEQWMASVGLSDEDSVYSEAQQEWWESEDFDSPPLPHREQFVDVAWEEAARRWNDIPEDARRERQESKRLEQMLDSGVMDETSMGKLIERRTSDDAMIERISQDVAIDSAWMAEAELTRAALDGHYEQHFAASTPQDRTHPLVWEEASRRWTELSDDARSTVRSEAEKMLNEEIEVVADDRAMVGTIRIGAAVFFAIFSLLMPFMPIGCTLSAIGLAFSIGSGLETG